MGHKNAKYEKRSVIKEGADPMVSEPVKEEVLKKIGPKGMREYIDLVCILTAVVAVEILLGVMVFKQNTVLLLIILGLNLVLGIVSCFLHPYFLFAVITAQLVAGGFSSHMVIAIEGIVLFAALCIAARKLLR